MIVSISSTFLKNTSRRNIQNSTPENFYRVINFKIYNNYSSTRKINNSSIDNKNKNTVTNNNTTTATKSKSNTNDNNEIKKWSKHKRICQIDLGNGITNIKLSRGKKMNSLDMQMFEDIVSIGQELKNDKSIRVIILSGEGRAFCTGLDLPSMMTQGNPFSNISKLLQRRSFDNNEESISNLAQDVGYIWRTIPVPVIAVLHGMCFGGGMQIALGADLRFATRNCQMSLMESKFGLIPDMSASITLRELVRIDVAKELAMTGKIISGTEAASLGLITRVSDDPMEEAINVSNQIISKSPDSVAACKRLFQNTWCSLNDESECLKLETDIQKDLLGSWNQIAATSKSFGVTLPFKQRKDFTDDEK